MARRIRIPKPYRPPQTEAEERKFGATFGARAARENVKAHGCTFAEVYGVRDLTINARERGSTVFDRAYAKAYVEVAKKLGCRVSNRDRAIDVRAKHKKTRR